MDSFSFVSSLSSYVADNSFLIFSVGALVIVVNSIDLIIDKALGLFRDDFDKAEYVGLESELNEIDEQIERLQERLNPALKRERLEDELDDLISRREALFDEINDLSEEYNR